VLVHGAERVDRRGALAVIAKALGPQQPDRHRTILACRRSTRGRFRAGH
jgi:hypothetical protein